MKSESLKFYLLFSIINIAFNNSLISGKSFKHKKFNNCKLNETCIGDKICFDTNKTCDAFVLFATTDGIQELELNNNFTNLNTSTLVLKTNLKNLNEIYYNLNENYIIYESDGMFNKFKLSSDKLSTNSNYELKNIDIKANSKLAIDWIHNLLYFISEKRKILVSQTEKFNPFLIANKIEDVIICLAVNPIESFIVWCDHCYQTYTTFINKAFQDGSNATQIFVSSDNYIRDIVIDHNSKRLFWFSSLELSSINFDGSDKRVISESVFEIYDFDLLGDYVYWTQFNGNQLFRASNKGFETYESSATFDFTINKFQLIHNSKQPNGVNQCSHSECSQLCLPVSQMTYRCVCINTINCTDNQIDIRSHEITQMIENTSSSSTTTLNLKSESDPIKPETTTFLTTDAIHSTAKSVSERYIKYLRDKSFRLAIIITFLSSLSIIIIIAIYLVIKFRTSLYRKANTLEPTYSEPMIYTIVKLRNSLDNIYANT